MNKKNSGKNINYWIMFVVFLLVIIVISKNLIDFDNSDDIGSKIIFILSEIGVVLLSAALGAMLANKVL